MIIDFLFLALSSLCTLEASILNLSKLKNDERSASFPKIMVSNRTVRMFGTASPVVEQAPTLVPPPLLPITVVSPKESLKPSVTPKRSGALIKRTRDESHTIEQNIEKYIQNELAYNAFKKDEKRVALRLAIEFIAENDYKGFEAFGPQFEAAFGREYHMFKRGPNKVDYMMHYIIRFGATNFITSWCYANRNANEDSNIEGAFEHLIATKPLDALFQFLRDRRHVGRDSVQKAISNAVKKRYPDLHFLDHIVFDSPSFFDDAFKIFEAKSEAKKLEALTGYLKEWKNVAIVPHERQLKILEITFRYRDYFVNLNVDLRFYLAQLAIANDNIDALTKIFDLDPELIFYFRETTLFAFAAARRAANMIKFFMEIVPELATTNVDGNLSPVALSIQIDVVNNLNVFEECGVDLSQAITYKDNLCTPVQLAFLERSFRTFNYFVDKYGSQYVMAQLLEKFGSTNEIMKHVARPEVRIGLIETLRDKLGFNLNDGYYFEGQTGNIFIFMDVSDSWREYYNEKLNLEN